MTSLIQSYYDGEKGTALTALAIATALILLSLMAWKLSSAGTIPRGMAYALLGFGIFLGASSGGYLTVVRQRVAAVEEQPSRPERELREAEIARMEQVLRSGYVGALAVFTALVAVGLVLVFVSHEHPLRKGVALGLLAAGVIGLCTEALSMRKNCEYLARVQAAYDVEPP
jgi:hypothetical protein